LINIAFAINYPEMEPLIRDVFDNQTQLLHESDVSQEYQLQIIHASSTDSLLRYNIQADVLIARGANAYDLRRIGYHIPVVELIISGIDLVLALDKAKKTYGIKPTAVLGSFNMIPGVENLSGVIGLPIFPYYLKENSLKEIIRNINEAHEAGITNFVGGVNGCRYAKSLGFNTTSIQSGREAISQAISEAMRTAVISREERQKSLMYRTIIDYAYEGVIAVDQNNELLVFNNVGKKLMGLPQHLDCSHKPAGEIIHHPEVTGFLKDSEEVYDRTVNIQDMFLLVNKVPILLNDTAIGKVMTFQDITKIQEMQGIIRGKIHSRGHNAKYSFADIIGKNADMEKIKTAAKKYAALDSNILIAGETGTGKELLAQSIHNYSSRAEEPFVAVNCAALPENLLESEFFGYADGAFTGASKGGKIGLFELAHNGTIFLDEISEIPLRLQGRLLRVIQEQQVMRLGDDRMLSIDVRVISASNKDLRTLIADGLFREDLYYRLNVFTLRVPSLRDRLCDVPMLAVHFIKYFCTKYRKRLPSLSKDAEETLMNYHWYGNIRELRNVCERMVALNDAETIGGDDVVDQLQPLEDTSELKRGCDPDSVNNGYQQVNRESIHAALAETRFNRTQAAGLLGISRVTLWRRMRELKIE